MSTYTLGHHASVLRSHAWRTAQNSAAYLLSHLKAGASVLDVGCGPGTITRDLADLVGPGGSVLGIDSSSEIVEKAREGQGSRDNLRFEVQDVVALDAADGTFDVVHAHQVLQHLGDPVQALREMARVTRPGGLVAVRDADYAAMTWFPQDPAMDEWLASYRQAARANGGEPDAGRRLLHWAREAGLEDATPSAAVWCFATPEERQWWGGLQADRITSSAVADQLVAAAMTDRQGLERMAAAWRRWAADDTGWFAVVHGELLCRVPGGAAA